MLDVAKLMMIMLDDNFYLLLLSLLHFYSFMMMNYVGCTYHPSGSDKELQSHGSPLVKIGPITFSSLLMNGDVVVSIILFMREDLHAPALALEYLSNFLFMKVHVSFFLWIHEHIMLSNGAARQLIKLSSFHLYLSLFFTYS